MTGMGAKKKNQKYPAPCLKNSEGEATMVPVEKILAMIVPVRAIMPTLRPAKK